jgi:hypothetical protein
MFTHTHLSTSIPYALYKADCMDIYYQKKPENWSPMAWPATRRILGKQQQYHRTVQQAHLGSWSFPTTSERSTAGN